MEDADEGVCWLYVCSGECLGGGGCGGLYMIQMVGGTAGGDNGAKLSLLMEVTALAVVALIVVVVLTVY